MTAHPIPRPAEGEYAPFYAGYVMLVPDGEVQELLVRQPGVYRRLLEPLDDARAESRYAEGKWTVKEVVAHVIDAERIFAYRLLRFARRDATALPGFDENAYIDALDLAGVSLPDLLDEFDAVRRANLHLVERLGDDVLGRSGEASGARMTVRALLYVIAGHAQHHLRILQERYLPEESRRAAGDVKVG